MVTYLAAFFTPRSLRQPQSSLVDPHPHPAPLPSAHPPHQAPAPRPLAPHHLPQARRLLRDPAALADDEDFGLVAGKDLTQLISLQAYSCVECGRCTEHCPASNTGKVLNPKEIILGTRTYLNTSARTPKPRCSSKLPKTPPTTRLPATCRMEAAFECTTCGACEFQCPVGIQHLPIIIGLRRGATNTGAWEDPYGTKLFLALEKSGNALGLQRHRSATSSSPSRPSPSSTAPRSTASGSAAWAATTPRAARSSPTSPASWTTSAPPSASSRRKSAPATPPAASATIWSSRISPKPASKTFAAAQGPEDRRHLPALRPHHRHRLARLRHRPRDRAPHRVPRPPPSPPAQPPRTSRATAAQTSAPAPETIAFHDPCYLGRYQNIYEQPRAVVALAGELVEAPRNHERSFCCGAGGGLAFLGERVPPAATATRPHQPRPRPELVATGAQTIGTACPFCNTMFRDALVAITPAGQTPPQLLDIAQLTARNLPHRD